MALHFLERYKVVTSPALPLPSIHPRTGLDSRLTDWLTWLRGGGCCAAQLMVVKITSKWELRRLCGAVNATALVRLGAPTADEAGACDLVEVREEGGHKTHGLRRARGR